MQMKIAVTREDVTQLILSSKRRKKFKWSLLTTALMLLFLPGGFFCLRIM
jgi:hypothetical protein